MSSSFAAWRRVGVRVVVEDRWEVNALRSTEYLDPRVLYDVTRGGGVHLTGSYL